jgi:hypothetical protein
MRFALTTAGIALIGLTLASCAAAREKEEIEELAVDFARAFEEGDADELASLFSAECETIEEDLVPIVQFIQDNEVEVELTGVEVRNLTDNAAELHLKGTRTVNDEEVTLDEEGKYHPLVKEDGDWKIADCEFFADEPAQ